MSRRRVAHGLHELRHLGQLMSEFLSPRNKQQLLRVSLCAWLVSLLEMCVAAAVIPYVQCLAGSCSPHLVRVLQPLGWDIISLLSLGLFGLITLKLLAQTWFNWMAARLGQDVQRDTVSRLLTGYLHLDWAHFRAHHRAHYLQRCTTTAVDAAYVTQQCVTMISSVLLMACLVALMLVQYPTTSLLVSGGFLLLNLLTQSLIGSRQRNSAQRREDALQRWNLDMAEAFSAFRELRVYGLERYVLQRIDGALRALAEENRKLGFLPLLPRQILDFAIFGILLLVVSAWLLAGRPLAELVPKLVFYAVVARVMLPAMMNLLGTRAQLFGSVFNIQLILDEWRRLQQGHVAQIGIVPTPAPKAVFALENLSFAYAPELPPVLQAADLRIEHPAWVALLGPSGAGKSTLIELLVGIHRPDSGAVRHYWPHAQGPRLAYVPQHVALLDSSVLENVVFGFDAGDEARVREVLALAALDALVERLPQGLHTRVGADGGRLSGGERQRLALARALYRQPDLLLLDEATSGLDEATEGRVLDNLRAARRDMSVVFITHRPANRRHADYSLHLSDGRLSDGAVPS